MDADAYTLGMFAVAVGGILALVWMILRAVTVLSLAHRQQEPNYTFTPLVENPPPPFPPPPIPPPSPPPPPPRPDEAKTAQWPARESDPE